MQAQIIPISDVKHLDYAQQVADQMRAAGLRVELDDRRERMNAKIREAQLQKIPYMLIIGDKEQAAGTVSVRLRSGADLGALPVAGLIARLGDEASRKAGLPGST